MQKGIYIAWACDPKPINWMLWVWLVWAHIRRAMFMTAFTVVRFKEPAMKELYERVYKKTKIKMKGYVAVQRKLLCLMYTLWKTDLVYDPKRNGVHSREEAPGGPLSGKISTAEKLEKTETSQKKSSPSVRRAKEMDFPASYRPTVLFPENKNIGKILFINLFFKTVSRIKFCGKNPLHRKAPTRWR